ncbi:hypothetical protein [Wolbachia endosymbiont of Ctenocephalides felis wCfeJ]|uniref:hypothetical protein n=1 Tax=Wolbachia endosymbiont of Ctenocephalides felis wCfeJ TaxID=2732594 RepID=UPI00144699FC|nr:hypothetical protein [Wolbachia endosymbiont of Ctenocephalides felis wCfeJ]WCR58489.1 MAG: hypothetical protein PG980_000961 [Wolbachia endosymbiont of Ctenocephalides felis wCfeJ]
MFKRYILSNLLNTCLILFMTVLLTGCFATIFSGLTQTIRIKVVDDEGNLIEKVKCTIYDPSGMSHSLTSNPRVVLIQRGSGPLSIDCTKAGYRQLNVMVGESFNKVALLNLLWWPGFVIDTATGAYKQYPSHYVVTMEKSDS